MEAISTLHHVCETIKTRKDKKKIINDQIEIIKDLYMDYEQTINAMTEELYEARQLLDRQAQSSHQNTSPSASENNPEDRNAGSSSLKDCRCHEHIETIAQLTAELSTKNSLCDGQSDRINALSAELKSLPTDTSSLYPVIDEEMLQPTHRSSNSTTTTTRTTDHQHPFHVVNSAESATVTLKVKPHDCMPSSQTMAIIKHSIDPIALQIRVQNVKTSSSGQVFITTNSEHAPRLESAINQSLPNQFNITTLKKRRPCIIMFRDNVSKGEDIIKHEFCLQNNFPENHITYKFSIPSRQNNNYRSIVWEVSPTLHRYMANVQKMHCGFECYKTDNFIPVKRCTNCQRYGHTSSKCTNDASCGTCSGSHHTSDCHSESAKCTNCLYYSKTKRLQIYSANHPSNHLACPVRKHIEDLICNTIEYGH